jgi:hypothetical protein
VPVRCVHSNAERARCCYAALAEIGRDKDQTAVNAIASLISQTACKMRHGSLKAGCGPIDDETMTPLALLEMQAASAALQRFSARQSVTLVGTGEAMGAMAIQMTSAVLCSYVADEASSTPASILLLLATATTVLESCNGIGQRMNVPQLLLALEPLAVRAWDSRAHQEPEQQDHQLNLSHTILRLLQQFAEARFQVTPSFAVATCEALEVCDWPLPSKVRLRFSPLQIFPQRSAAAHVPIELDVLSTALI